MTIKIKNLNGETVQTFKSMEYARRFYSLKEMKELGYTFEDSNVEDQE